MGGRAGQRKLDNRIRILIENGVQNKHRSMFVIVGDEGKDQVVILHHILTKATLKARPNVLWCYKKELGFNTHRKKQMRLLQKVRLALDGCQVKKLKSGKSGADEEDPFELFIASTNIRYCYYSETQKILGNTYGICILQDFEAVTPNLLARTIETVEGGGLVILLIKSVDSLKQLYAMAMDVHGRYRTEAHQDLVCRFNERFILSLGSSPATLVVDHRLNVLPLSSHAARIQAVEPKAAGELGPAETELAAMKESMRETKAIGPILAMCRTLDQAKALLKLLDLVTEKSLRQTASLTAARGRGKSAALGLAMAGAVGFGYSNIFVTSPSPENLKTLFEFIVKGLEALDYQEHMDYELIQSTNSDFNNAIVRLNVFKDHRQTIQYISPGDSEKLGQAELLVVDEAAAIPLPLVKKLLGPYLVFLSSTINGYEGTGRSLSLKLISQLRAQTSLAPSTDAGKKKDKKDAPTDLGRSLHELTLDESIRYAVGDPIEAWLNRLLCLDPAAVTKLGSGTPSPNACELYYIDRDTLFSFHSASELFLQRLMSIYVAAHYKNSPNDLQMLSDAPAHHLFCLLGPRLNPAVLPEILCVVQVCLEGEISRVSVESNFSRGKRASGDLIPWTLAQQFQDNDFPGLCGARVVRIATHPDYQRMGYGKRALQLLEQYYRGDIAANLMDEDTPKAKKRRDQEAEAEAEDLLSEKPKPRKDPPPLLLALTERRAEKLDWLGVSFGLTGELLRFWKRSGMAPVYLRQTANDLTGEHSTIMLKLLGSGSPSWLIAYWSDFRRRLLRLLGLSFRAFPTELGLSLLQRPSSFPKEPESAVLSRSELGWALTDGDLRRLELYGRNLVDHHLVSDLLPGLAALFFTDKMGLKLSPAQSAILLGMGLQGKSVDELGKELDVPVGQLLALFNKAVKKSLAVLNGVCEKSIEAAEGLDVVSAQKVTAKATRKTLQEELSEAGRTIEIEQAEKKRRLLEEDLSEFRIKAAEDDFETALSTPNPKGILSVKRQESKKTPSLLKDKADEAVQDPAGLLDKKRKRKSQKH